MIVSQAELEYKLTKVAELQAELAERRERLGDSPDAIAFTGSHQRLLNELMQEVQEYLVSADPEPDYRFQFSGGKAASHSIRVTTLQDFCRELQTLVWLSSERVLGLNPRPAGIPGRLVRDNCSLTMAFARQGSLDLGFNYIVESLLPDEDLQDSTATYLATASEVAVSEDFVYAQKNKIDQQILNHLASLGRVSDMIATDNQAKYKGKLSKLCLSKRMAVGAENLVTRFKSSKPYEGDVHIGILNFYSGKYHAQINGEKVPLYYEPGVISKELAELAANKILHVKGTLFTNHTGKIERMVVNSAELASGADD